MRDSLSTEGHAGGEVPRAPYGPESGTFDGVA